MGEMTARERWLAALRCQPVDRLPFWPKLDGAYPQHQREPFGSMGNTAIHTYIGSDLHVGGPDCVQAVFRHGVSIEVVEEGLLRRRIFSAPAGSLTCVERFDRPSWSWHPIEFAVKRRQDIALLTEVLDNTTYVVDAAQCERARALVESVGEGGITTTSLGISPLMDWLQHLAGIENGHYFLSDYRTEVEELFGVMHRGLLQRTEIIATHAPYPVIYSVENTSTTLLSPDLFMRYCYPHLADYGRIIHAAGKLHVLHMCGKLKKLLPAIGTLPAVAIEAFTSPPVGNTSWLDGRTDAPGMCFIGGTNATDWMEPADVIIAHIARDLGTLPHHRGIVVTSAGVMPPACQPETIRRVGEWVRAYPVAV